jgi:hypothetical protein
LHRWEEDLDLEPRRRAGAIDMADELLGLFESAPVNGSRS